MKLRGLSLSLWNVICGQDRKLPVFIKYPSRWPCNFSCSRKKLLGGVEVNRTYVRLSGPDSDMLEFEKKFGSVKRLIMKFYRDRNLYDRLQLRMGKWIPNRLVTWNRVRWLNSCKNIVCSLRGKMCAIYGRISSWIAIFFFQSCVQFYQYTIFPHFRYFNK